MIAERLFAFLVLGMWTVCFMCWEKDFLQNVNDQRKNIYLFIYSIHLLEYRVYDKNVKPMGNIVEKQRENGFLVRSPWEDWMPYLMASDIIVTDYTSMGTLALLAGKKIIYSYFPDSIVWKKSLSYKAKHILPIIKRAEDLEVVLEKVQNENVEEALIEECRKNLYMSSDEYNQRIINITRELLKNNW